jgi:hypothetical protein
MKKTHVRSYSIEAEGDLAVFDVRNGDVVDLSKHYAELPRDRRMMVLDAHLDVFRYTNGDLTWIANPNGHSPEAAETLKFLLTVFVEDAKGGAGAPRAF